MAETLRARTAAALGGADRFALRQVQGDRGILFHHRRRLADGELVLLVNTSLEASCSGVVEGSAAAVERWDCRTGKVSPFAAKKKDEVCEARFSLPPCGSLLLLFAHRAAAEQIAPPAVAARGKRVSTLKAVSSEIRRLAPNVLTLDYVDLATGGPTQKNLYHYRANQLVWQANGMDRNPWDSAVQFKDELIAHKFPAESGFTATYRFTIDGAVPKPLAIVVERADLYSVACNGQAIAVAKDSWWLDRAFSKLDISAAARSGANEVTIRARPMTMFHELQPAYLLGDFSLAPVAQGFVVRPPKPLAIEGSEVLIHGSERERTMWLTSGVGFRREAGKKGDDVEPWITFDLGKRAAPGRIEVWNYNESDHAHRGVKQMEIAVGDSVETLKPLGTFELAPAKGAAENVAVNASGRYVRFRILANHNGIRYPAREGSLKNDNAFVGLSEVAFYAAGAEAAKLEGVRIQAASSELVASGHDRRAAYVVDGSGLAKARTGWNLQGMPFYGAGVAYRQTFELAKPSGRYRVVVRAWNGSVAHVTVNGKLCGHLAWQPWRCDVTEALRAAGTRSKLR